MNEIDQKQLGEVFAQSRSNSDEIKNLRQDFSQFASQIRDAIEHLGDRLNRAGRTDWTALATWAGVVVAFIFGVMSPVLWYQNHSVDALDSKLQKEFALSIETTQKENAALARSLKDVSDSAERLSMERHTFSLDKINEVKSDLESLRQFVREQVKDDLNELRQRRAVDRPVDKK